VQLRNGTKLVLHRESVVVGGEAANERAADDGRPVDQMHDRSGLDASLLHMRFVCEEAVYEGDLDLRIGAI